MDYFKRIVSFRYWVSGVLLVVIANIPLFSDIRAPKWDAFDEMWNYFRWLGSSLRHGYFPDFFPNVLSGYPIGSNIQAGTYNVFYLLSAYIFPDSILSINTVYLTTQIAIFSLSYAIGRSFQLNSISCLYFGLAITASGFVIGHASHFSYLTTATGLLGSLLAIRLALNDEYRLAYIAALISVYHMLTAGYPANIIFGAQCIILYWVFLYINESGHRKGLLLVALGAISGLLISAPSIWHFVNLLLQSNRGSGLDIDVALSGSLPSYSLLNLFNPVWYMRFTEPSMERFHLLFITTPLLFISIYFGIYRGRNPRLIIINLLLIGLFTLLALGKNSPLPLREWLAENIFIYRAGRFPSGEHRGVALFLIAFISAFGLQWLMDHWSVKKKWLILILVLDFMIVMYGLKSMRISKVDIASRGVTAMYNVELDRTEQSILDAPRNCTPDGKSWAQTAIRQQRKLAPNGFYWNAYTSLRLETHDNDRGIAKDYICGPSRLWNHEKRKPYKYDLSIYTPGYIRFHLLGEHHKNPIMLIWADVNDGFWKLKINGEESQYIPTLANLRAFKASAGDEIEMIYEGPLTRMWR